MQDARARARRAEHRESVGVGAQRVEEHADALGIERQLFANGVGVVERLLLRRALVVVEQVAAGEAVGDTDEDDAGEQRDEGEEEGDPGSQSQGSAPRHRCSVAGPLGRVHPLPVECKGEECIPPGQREQQR